MEQLRDMSDVCTDPKRTGTTSRMSDEELAAVTCTDAAIRCPTPFLTSGIQESYRRNVCGALFDTKGMWNNTKALVLWADMSCMYCLWGAKLLWDMLNASELVTDGDEQRRDVQMVKLESANHFVSIFTLTCSSAIIDVCFRSCIMRNQSDSYKYLRTLRGSLLCSVRRALANDQTISATSLG